MSVIRVLAIDDSETFLRGVESLLALEPGIELVGKAGNGSEALRQARGLHPDVILADLRLCWDERVEKPTQADGLRTIQALARCCPQAWIVVISSFWEQRWVVQAMDAGAQGYLAKEASAEQIVAAIRTVAQRGVVLTAEQFSWLREPVESLTPREREVLTLLAEGYSDAEIGRRLGIASRTASKHVENIREKLEAGSRWEAVATARRRGLI